MIAAMMVIIFFSVLFIVIMVVAWNAGASQAKDVARAYARHRARKAYENKDPDNTEGE